MKIALDRHISPKINLPGHEIVIWAGDERDEIWVEKAIERKAEVLISQDYDIPNLLDQHNYEAHWISYPQNLKGERLNKFILKEINKLC